MVFNVLFTQYVNRIISSLNTCMYTHMIYANEEVHFSNHAYMNAHPPVMVMLNGVGPTC